MFGEHVDTSTLYRWSGIGLGPKPGQSFADYLSYMRGKGYAFQGACQRIRGTRTLIIDEVSMMPGRILEFIDYVCREVRSDPRPFGGIQLVAVGRDRKSTRLNSSHVLLTFTSRMPSSA
jgi:hypothetical protein